MARRPVFVSRRFPPSVGGMETLAHSVWRSIYAERRNAILIAHGGSNRGLLTWMPRTFVEVANLLLRRRVQCVLTGDALMCAVLSPLLNFSRIPLLTIVHGLDVTHPNRLYRWVVLPRLRRASMVIANSMATKEAAISAGVPRERITVLRLGVDAPDVDARDRSHARDEVHRLLALPMDQAVLLTLGRLVRRKGVRWFVEGVLPRLPANVHYVVAGDGPEFSLIAHAAALANVTDRVHLLGRVDDTTRELLMRGADLFVQPNIEVPGDMEGFGLVTIESAMRGVPVVAADLEGLRDAVIPQVTGYLVPSADEHAWTSMLIEQLADVTALREAGVRFQEQAKLHYGEQVMGRALVELLGLRSA